MGDVSVLVLSGVWQSRRLTSPLRGRGEPKLFIVPADAGVANMTKRALGAELLVSAIQLLPFSSTLLPAQNPTSKLWGETEGRSTEALHPGNFRPLHVFSPKRASCWDRPLPLRSSWYS